MDQKCTFKQRTRYYLVLCHVLAEARKSRTRSVRDGALRWSSREQRCDRDGRPAPSIALLVNKACIERVRSQTQKSGYIGNH